MKERSGLRERLGSERGEVALGWRVQKRRLEPFFSILDFEVLSLSLCALCRLQARLRLKEGGVGSRGDRERRSRWPKRLAEVGQLLARKTHALVFFSQGAEDDDARFVSLLVRTRAHLTTAVSFLCAIVLEGAVARVDCLE